MSVESNQNDILTNMMKVTQELEEINKNKENDKDLQERLDSINKLELDHVTQRKNLKELIGQVFTGNIKINDNVYQDLEIFYNYNFQTENTLFSKINKCYTVYGEYYLQEVLNNPTSNIQTLQERQNKIKELSSNQELLKILQNELINIKNTESHHLWFWDQGDDIHTIYEMVYFDFYNLDFFNQIMNTNETLLQWLNVYKIYLNPAMTIIIPLLGMIVPLVLMKLFGRKVEIKLFFSLMKSFMSNVWKNSQVIPMKYKFITAFSTGIWIFFYLQSIYYSGSSAYNTHKIINVLHQKINYVAQIVNSTHTILSHLPENFTSLSLNDLILQNKFNHELFKESPGWITHKGKILSTYYDFNKNIDYLIPYFKFIGEVDFYMGLTELYLTNHSSNSEDDDKVCYSIVEYLERNKPRVEIKDLWDPSLLQENSKIITNDLNLKHTRNLLITGPNAGGKSTYLKSMAINILLSQTIGLAPASEIKITPFSVINTYLNIPDCLGKSSLFEAEMYRAKDHLEMIKNLGDKEFAFVIMDEIFSSTNFYEGYSGAYAIIKKLIQSPRSISIITTHFTELSKLEEDTRKIIKKGHKKYYQYLIKNYKMTCEMKKYSNNHVEFNFPYKIQPGVSNQYIALEILRKNNFDSDLIDDAIKVMEEIKNKNEKCV